MIDLLETYRDEVRALEVVIGHTKSYINGTKSACRKGECTFGNLISNSLVFARKKAQMALRRDQDTFVSLVQTGGIKLSLDNSSADHAITLAELDEAYPYQNQIYVAQLRGNLIRKALERSAFFYDEEENGGYLQFAGLEVIFNMTNPLWERVVKASIETAPGFYEPLDDEKTYNVVANMFILNGGDGYNWSDPDIVSKSIALGTTDTDAMKEYLKENDHYLDLGLEGRQTILT